MKSQLLKLFKNPFVRNVATVMTGKVAAQVIAVGLTPIITRLYDPTAFGALGVFTSATGILTSAATLTYAMAIVLPKKDEQAKDLMRLSILIAVAFAMVVAFLLLLFSKPIIQVFGLDELRPFIIFIPPVIVFVGLERTFSQWLIRKKRFKTTAKIDLTQSLLQNGGKAGLGFVIPTASTLISVSVVGKMLHALLLIYGSLKGQLGKIGEAFQKEKWSFTQLKQVAKAHRDFPTYRAPQTLLVAFSQNLPVLILASFFGPAPAGFYSLGKKILVIPSSLISAAVQNVIYPRLAESNHRNQALQPQLLKATAGLGAIGIIPFGLVVAFGPTVFKVIFGAEWLVAGEYARWLAIMIFFQFINKPSVAAIPVLRLQGFLLKYEITAVTLRVTALMLGFYLFYSDIVAVAFFCGVSALMYIILIIYVITHPRTKHDSSISFSP